MTTTYDLMRGAARVQMEIEENSGLLSEETAAFLTTWIEQSEDKVLACMHLVRRMEAEAELLEREEKARIDEKDRDQKFQERMASLSAASSLETMIPKLLTLATAAGIEPAKIAALPCASFTRRSSPATISSASSHGTATKGSAPRALAWRRGPCFSQPWRIIGRGMRTASVSAWAMPAPMGDGSRSAAIGCSFTSRPSRTSAR